MLFLAGMFMHVHGRYAECIPLLGAEMLSFLIHTAGNCSPQVHTVTLSTPGTLTLRQPGCTLLKTYQKI